MALWEFTNLNKHGNFRTRIIHTEGALNLPGGGLGKMVFVKRFKLPTSNISSNPVFIAGNNEYIVASFSGKILYTAIVL